MTRSLKLTDLQLVLLSAAATRADGMVLPQLDSVRARGKTLDRALTKLLALEFIEESPTDDPARTWRLEDDTALGLAINAAGRAALGLEASDDEDAKPKGRDSTTAATGSTDPGAKMSGDALPLTPPALSRARSRPGWSIC